jgi:hypothetical protein
MADHLSLDGVCPLCPYDVGDADAVRVMVFQTSRSRYNCQVWMGWFMGKIWGHSPNNQLREENYGGHWRLSKKTC